MLTPPDPPDTLLRHRSFVRGLALALARDAHEAEELEQDVWLAAAREAGRSADRR